MAITRSSAKGFTELFVAALKVTRVDLSERRGRDRDSTIWLVSFYRGGFRAESKTTF